MSTLKSQLIFLIVASAMLFTCTESYNLKSKNSESLLIIEATITDEFKSQEIKLSKTFSIDSGVPNEVSNALVWIEAEDGMRFDFEESQPGLYTSVEMFQAEAGQHYTMHTRLSDGTSYVSTTELLPPSSQIESLEAVLITVDGEEGVQVLVNSSGGSDAEYFKYDYEETYKVVVPFYNLRTLEILNPRTVLDEFEYDLEFFDREEDFSTCYSTVKSKDIIQTSLLDSNVGSVTDFPVRYIKKDNGIMRDRYSILVTQQVQSLEAYNFYKILKALGTVDNVFNNNQPGFLQGNITAVNDPEENVIGFFQVTSVSKERIYFNYNDFGLRKPPYIYECDFQILDYNDNTLSDGDRDDRIYIYTHLNVNYSYFDVELPLYTLVSIQCAECTSLSSIEIPEFWED
ncbi:MAG: DUF4249 domain-containing protein [Aquaticitalea sp.]